jgi:pantoate--beta-alanine ligase
MPTRLITSVSDVRSYAHEQRPRGLALVPTMGALHDGHRSLIRRAQRECDAVLVSIFVNPKQFNSGEDFNKYPRDPEKDSEALRALNVDAIFAPDSEDIYPPGFGTYVEPGNLAQPFEGAARPGHFRGVTTIVLKLFNLVQPEFSYFGQKDFQQVRVIRQMVEDLNLNVRLVICPTIREIDGLAMSSRNALLGPEARRAATALHRCLHCGETLFQAGAVWAERILNEMRAILDRERLVALDYLALVNPVNLEPVACATPGTVALLAARVGDVRLIDNLIFGPAGSGPEKLVQLAFAA